MSATTTDSKFDLLLSWLRQHRIEPNIEKLKRQVVCVSRWQAANCNGSIEAVTGFGKTYVALFAMYLIQIANPLFTFIVIVPSEKLFSDWNGHIEHFGLKNVKVYIVNSFTKEKFWNDVWSCNVLIGDEGHRYLGEESVYFSKVLSITKRDACLMMSATLDDREKAKLRDLNLPVVDTISMLEAKRMGYISEYTTYNFAVDLNKDDRENYDRLHKFHNDMYARFSFFSDSTLNYKLATACSLSAIKNIKIEDTWRSAQEWRNWYAEQMQWDGITKEHEWSPTNIAKYAANWNRAMVERKNLLYKHESKIKAAVDIIKLINAPTITFSETTDVADKLKEYLQDEARVYYSSMEAEIRKIPEQSKSYATKKGAENFALKVNGIVVPDEDNNFFVQYYKEVKFGTDRLKKEVLHDYELNKFKYLLTAKALDEGFNVEGIECAVILSATSKQRQYIQRQGRAIRFVAGKKARIINVYLRDTKDQKWLEQRQRGERGIRWIDNINQIEI